MLTLVNYIKNLAPVIIVHTTDRGYPEYAVYVAEEPECWINTFTTLSRAQKYCERLNLPVVKQPETKI